MFTKEPAPQTTVPILNKIFTGWISHIQSLNCAYFHLKEWHEEFPKRLEILFEFYEETNRKSNDHDFTLEFQIKMEFVLFQVLH